MERADHGELRLRARKAHQAGRLAAAVALQRALVESAKKAARLEPRDLKFLSFVLHEAGDFEQCLAVLDQYLVIEPNDVESLSNKSFLLAKCFRDDEAAVTLERALRLNPTHDTCLSILCDIHFRKGDLPRAREVGRRVLEIRASLAEATEFDPTKGSVPQFRAAPPRNIISFSLWGDSPRYLNGALRNVRLAPDIYPDWTCRFYLDETVPPRFVAALREWRADIVMMPTPSRNFEGLFWRFLVADDPLIDRYLVRDADSVINIQERVAVDAWIKSNRHFHVMRDWWTHRDVMLAGLWGGVRQALPPVAPLIDRFIGDTSKKKLWGKVVDQIFLRTSIWPIVRQSVLQHDSIFSFSDAEPFPVYGRRGHGQHVGQDDSILQEQLKAGESGRLLSPREVGIGTSS